MAKNKPIHPGDLAMWGAAVVATALGVWAAVVADTLPGKLASAGMALAFWGPVVGLYLWRRKLRKHDFVAWGVLVRLGKKHRPDRQDVANWVNEVIRFWANHYSESGSMAALDGVLLVYVDVLKMGSVGRWMAGYSTSNTAVVGYAQGDWERSRSLTIHELSHHSLMGLEPAMAWEGHHAFFAQKGLGH